MIVDAPDWVKSAIVRKSTVGGGSDTWRVLREANAAKGRINLAHHHLQLAVSSAAPGMADGKGMQWIRCWLPDGR